MSSGGATATTTTSASPAQTAHRRHVADFMDSEKGLDCYILNTIAAAADNDDHQHRSPLIRFLPLLRKNGPCLSERVLRTCLVSGPNVGRAIFAALMMMVVVSVFVKVSFMVGGNVERESGGTGWRRENGRFIV